MLRPVEGSNLKPVPAESASCRQPPERTDQFRVPEQRLSWKTLAVDADGTYAWDEPAQTAATADGAIWALYDMNPAAGYEFDRLRRWNGSAWQTIKAPPPPVTGPFDNTNPHSAVGLAAMSARQEQVFGRVGHDKDSAKPGVFVHAYDEGRWRSEIFPLTSASYDARWIGVDGPWMVQERRALRSDGSTWLSYQLPAMRFGIPAYGGPVIRSAANGDELWVLGQDDESAGLMRWKNSTWQEIGIPKLGPPPGSVLTEFGRSMHTGDGEEETVLFRALAMHWNGNGWSCHWAPSKWGSASTFTHAEPDGAGGMWMVGKGDRFTALWHLSGGRWTRESLPAPKGCNVAVLDLAHRPGSTEVYALGQYGPTGQYRCRDAITRSVLWRTR